MLLMRRAQRTALLQVLRNLGSAAVGERLTYQIKIGITREELGGVSPLPDLATHVTLQSRCTRCRFHFFFRHLQVNHLNCFPFPSVSVSSLRKTPQVLCNVMCSLRYRQCVSENGNLHWSTRAQGFCFVSNCHDASSSFFAIRFIIPVGIAIYLKVNCLSQLVNDTSLN